MRARPALFLALTALIAVGCAVGGGPEPSPDEPPAPTETAVSADADGTDTPEEFANDIQAAQEVAADYWAGRIGAGFQPIQQVIAYERDGEVDCGGEPLPRNNAVYCSAGDFIAYDVNWSFGAFRQIGDAFVFYLLGHEYAHGVQARLGIRKEFTIEQELQADCMAGAFIGDQEKAGRLVMQEGDTEELAAGLEAVGDEPGQPWFAEGSHGSPQQRIQSFAEGYQDSLDACGL